MPVFKLENLSTKALQGLEIVGEIPIIDSLLEVICRTTGMGFAAIASVTDTEWVACALRDEISFGLEIGGQLPLQSTLCYEISRHHNPVVISEVISDDKYADHHTPLAYGFQSYISYPIRRSDGEFFGTLCAIDPKPRDLNNPQSMGMFKLFAELISFHLDSAEKLIQSRNQLQEEKETSNLREQFIAILGHDLRNPVSAISANAQLLQQLQLEPTAHKVAGNIYSSTKRISNLVDNMLDFARGRMGNGIAITKANSSDIEKLLKEVISEIKATHPSQHINLTVALKETVQCDCNRLGQLFSNLLANAVTYGKTGGTIVINASTDEERFILSVSNEGIKIPPRILGRLFQPFTRGEDLQEQKGLGIGLYIASEIAGAHNGTLVAESSDEATVFTLSIPLAEITS